MAPSWAMARITLRVAVSFACALYVACHDQVAQGHCVNENKAVSGMLY